MAGLVAFDVKPGAALLIKGRTLSAVGAGSTVLYLADLLGTMTVIPPLPLSEAKHQVEQHFLKALGNTPAQTETLDQMPA